MTLCQILTENGIIMTGVVINTAFSDEFIGNVSKEIFAPTLKGESVYCRFFPGHGRSVRLQQIFLEDKFLREGFGKAYQKFVIVRIDASDFAVTHLDHFFVYVKSRLIEEMQRRRVVYREAKKVSVAEALVFSIHEISKMCTVCVARGYEVVFVIEVGNWELANEKEFYSAWAKIVEANLDKIHTHIDIETRDPLDKGALPAVLIQSIVNVPLPGKKDCDRYIDYYLDNWKMTLSNKNRVALYDICGHDTWLIKEALRAKATGKSVSDILFDANLFLKAQIEWRLFGQKEKETIALSLKTLNIPKSLDSVAATLEDVNFWDRKRKTPLIFQQVIIQSESAGELSWDPGKNTMYLGPIDLTTKFSGLEIKLLAKLFTNLGRVVKREEIAKVIWGVGGEEKYSDWAIDKVVSRVRGKLSNYTNTYQITTKKKSGFMLTAA